MTRAQNAANIWVSRLCYAPSAPRPPTIELLLDLAGLVVDVRGDVVVDGGPAKDVKNWGSGSLLSFCVRSGRGVITCLH